jgi:hypothetical protein
VLRLINAKQIETSRNLPSRVLRSIIPEALD